MAVIRTESDIQRKVILTLTEPTPTSRSAHPRAAHTLPCKIEFHTALEGEYKRSVLGEYSSYKEGSRVKTANVRRYSSQ